MPTRQTPNKKKAKTKAATKAPPKSRKPLPSARIAAQLRQSFGNVTHAAKRLRLNRSALHDRIQREPELQAVIEEAREVILDEAENALHRSIIKRAPWAVIWALKTIGRRRGYRESDPIDPNRISWDDLSDDQLRRIAAGDDPKFVLAKGRAKAT